MSSHEGGLVEDFGWVPNGQAVHLGDRVKNVEGRRRERRIVLDSGAQRKGASIELTSASLRRDRAPFVSTAYKFRRHWIHRVVISTLSMLEKCFFRSAVQI